MRQKIEREAIRPSQVVEMMHAGQRYLTKDFAQKLRRTENYHRVILQEMVKEGAILVTAEGRSKYYELPKDDEAVLLATPGRYVPEWKELGVVDMTSFQRQCEATRNPEKGVV